MSRLFRRCARSVRGREHVIAMSSMVIAMGVFVATLLFSQFNWKNASTPTTQTQELAPTPTQPVQPAKPQTGNVEDTHFARVGESTLSGNETSILLNENGSSIDQERLTPLFPLDPPEVSNQLRLEFLDALTKSAIDPALQSHEYKNVPQVPEPTPGLLLWFGLCSLIQFRGKQLASSSRNT